MLYKITRRLKKSTLKGTPHTVASINNWFFYLLLKVLVILCFGKWGAMPNRLHQIHQVQLLHLVVQQLHQVQLLHQRHWIIGQLQLEKMQPQRLVGNTVVNNSLFLGHQSLGITIGSVLESWTKHTSLNFRHKVAEIQSKYKHYFNYTQQGLPNEIRLHELSCRKYILTGSDILSYSIVMYGSVRIWLNGQ